MDFRLLKVVYSIAWKDVVGDFRRRDTLSSMVFFSISVLVTFQIGFDPDRQLAVQLMPGLLWVTALFTSLVGLGRAFQDEEEDGGIETMILSPVPRGVLFLGKWLGNLFLTLVVNIILLILTMVLFNVDGWSHIFVIIAILALGTMGVTGLGVLLAALTQGTRSRETLLALLLLPLVVPLLIAGVQATAGALTGGDISPWIRLMVVFDVIYLTLAPWAFGWLVEE